MLAPRIDLRQILVDRNVGRLIPEVVARQVNGVCIGRLDDQTLNVAVADLQDTANYSNLIESGTPQRFRARFVAADPASIKQALEFVYSLGNEAWATWLEKNSFQGATTAFMPAASLPNLKPPKIEVLAPLEGSPEQRWERILREARSWKCSHIHLETSLDKLKVRLRQDGHLRTFEEIPKLPPGHALLELLKSKVDADTGQLSVSFDNQTYTLSCWRVPVAGGENWVLELGPPLPQLLNLDQLGLAAADLDELKLMVRQPYGLMVASSPNQSGKSTTLAAVMRSLASAERKLVSAEDNYDFPLDGVTQVRVDVRKGDSYPGVIEQLLRQNPDVLLVGEIRDRETALHCLAAAESGHLVLSALRCSDCSSALQRLNDLEVGAARLASSLLGILAQRLVRRNCTFCQQALPATPEQEALFRRVGINQWHLRKGDGCPSCQRQGYRGLIGVYEVLRLNHSLRNLVAQGRPGWEITAATPGFQSLLHQAVLKASQGIIPVTEIERVCQDWS